MSVSTALRLSGRDALALLHRTTSNALADLLPGQARATLFCDFRGRLLQRAVVARTSDGAIWLLRPDAPGAELAAAVERTVFRDDVRIEDRSNELAVVLARALPGTAPGVEERDGTPHRVLTGDGTSLVLGVPAGAPAAGGSGSAEPLGEAARIALLHPRHGHEIVEAYNPFEVGLAHEVHLAKGCFTGQEALQRLITYESVRRRPVHVRLGGGAPPASPVAVPADVLANGQPVGALTSVWGGDGLVVVRREAIEGGAALALADGTPLVVVSAPEPARPLGRA